MNDIVGRIRARFPRPQHADDGLLANEAADEIERLRQEQEDTLNAQLQRAEAVIDAARIWKRETYSDLYDNREELSQKSRDILLDDIDAWELELIDAVNDYDKEHTD